MHVKTCFYSSKEKNIKIILKNHQTAQQKKSYPLGKLHPQEVGKTVIQYTDRENIQPV